MYKYLVIILCFLIADHTSVNAQGMVHSKNIESRTLIDAKRKETNEYDKEALLRSIEYIKIDSSYYVGHLMEGIYRYEHASDYFGFKNAITPLQKALEYISTDYDNKIKGRSSDAYVVYYAYPIQLDYQVIVSALFNCYMNTDAYVEAYELCKTFISKNIQTAYYFGGFTSLTWLYNKLRIYNSKDYYFLENSIQDNIAMCQVFLDSAMNRNMVNSKINKELLPNLYDLNKYSIYHYRAILYAYNFQIDSADKYYDLLKESGSYSHNNRGNYLMTKGLFELAEEEYLKEEAVSEGDKHLREYVYFLTFLDINKNAAYESISRLKNTIKSVGSTPGFGWYNIALARAKLYDGNINQAEFFLDKAKKFKELHIGTTLNQSHYDFAIQILDWTLIQKKIKWMDRRWKHFWFNPFKMFQYLKLKWLKYNQEYVIIKLLESNPEREHLVYQLMSSESVILWDEIYQLTDILPASYFEIYYDQLVRNNTQRIYIQPYYQLFLAKFKFLKGQNKDALHLLQKILENEAIDSQYGKLLYARIFELKGIIEDELNINSKESFNKVYDLFPSVAGYNNYKYPFILQWNSNVDESIIDYLNDANIELVKNVNEAVGVLHISSQKRALDKILTISVSNAEGTIIIPEQTFISKDDNALQLSLIRTIFGMVLNRNNDSE